MGGQSHILILGQRTWIWYEPGNNPMDCRLSRGSVLSFNGPAPAHQSHIKKMLNCRFQSSAVGWRHIIGMGERGSVWNELGRWIHQQAKVHVAVSYERVAAFRVMVDTDQLNIQYHNYSKSWCNVSHMDGSVNLRSPEVPKHCRTDIHHRSACNTHQSNTAAYNRVMNRGGKHNENDECLFPPQNNN